GWLFLVMELLAGESLFERMRVGAMPVEEVLPILAQICSGLEAAHARGVVHRDLKPENVFLVDGPAPWVKLLDFGIAKITDSVGSSETAAGVVVGTPEYASPEQATGAAVDGRADLYGLGIVAWRMLAGYHPFPTEDSRRLLMMHATRPVPPIADARPDLARWPGVAALVDRACAKDPEQRFQSAAELRAAIEACLPPGLRAAAAAPSASPFPRLSPTPRVSARTPIAAALDVGRAVPLAASSSATPLLIAPRRRSRISVAGAVVATIAVILATGATATSVHRRNEQKRDEVVAAAAAAERAQEAEAQRRAEEAARRSQEESAAAAAAAQVRERESRQRELDRLVDSARKASGAARMRALTQLRQLGAEGRIPAAEAYAPLLASPDCDLRKAAAQRLGEIGDRAALKPLRTLAKATREVDEGYLFKRRAPECGAAEAAGAATRIERQLSRRAAR
ncbi:MAG TPA: serine/threonine-protein kinase, partial [Anaeromyxobacteraceae bacterium]|nr:serine/threonine-protein kinase [Anaeromyxobacteraceae bacterium]